MKDNYGNQAIAGWSFMITVMVTGERWALLLGSANDLAKNTTLEKAEVEDEVPNPSFEENIGDMPTNWKFAVITPDPIPWWGDPLPGWGFPALDGTYCVGIELPPGSDGYWLLTSDSWIPVTPNTEYTVTAWYTMNDWVAVPTVAYLGINWYDSGGEQIGGTVWSPPFPSVPIWTPMDLTTTSPPNAAYADIKLRGQNPTAEFAMVWFDLVHMWHYGYIDNPSPVLDQDAFPAQALQAYWVLRNHGYDDDHIILMLYHMGDNFISIDDNNVNALTGAAVDVEDEDVTKGRLENEIRDLAAVVEADDNVLIYLVDHGSHDGANAYFHFETGDNLSGQELDNWLDQITCNRITVLVDSCYSGDFIDPLNESGRILVSACGPPGENLAKYWTGVDPSENIPFAGSWFFHSFWESIDTGASIGTAYNLACSSVPAQFGPYAGMTVENIQNPQLIDNVGDVNSYTFV